MRLTDEERRIADDVARHFSCILDSVDDAWARALEYIAARRKAFGEVETPGTATAAGVGSHEVEVRVGQGDDGTGVPLTARIVRPATAAPARSVSTGSVVDSSLEFVRIEDSPCAHFLDTLHNDENRKEVRRVVTLGAVGYQWERGGYLDYMDDDRYQQWEVLDGAEARDLEGRYQALVKAGAVEDIDSLAKMTRSAPSGAATAAGVAAPTEEAGGDECSVLRELLSVYVHAHDNDNSVPPHIVAEAKKAAWRRAKGGEA